MSTTFDHIRTITENNKHGLSPDALARAIWTIAGEPGDSSTGELITTLGPGEALRYVVDGTAAMFEDIDVQTIRARTLPKVTDESIEQAFRVAARAGAILVTPEHPHWPTGLGDLGTSAPHALWARGNTALLTAAPGIAVVGARAATGYGEHMTMELAAGLVEKGYSIISGAAYGIDGMAHRAALASGGSTVAILAGGVDRFYPAGHDALLTRIVEAGVVVSELSCGQAPTKWRFLMRKSLSSFLCKWGWAGHRYWLIRSG